MCPTTSTLARILRRAKDGNFELMVSLVQNQTPKLAEGDAACLSSCRRLKMVNGNSDAFLQLFSDVRSLEELKIFGTNSDYFQRFFERLNLQNTSLTHLSLEGHLDRQWCRYSNMLSRIRVLNLDYYGTASPEDMVEFFASLTGLKELTLSGGFLNPRTYSIRSKDLKTMTLKFLSVFCFTPQTYRSVIQLSLIDTRPSVVHNSPVMMPSLEKLAITGPWTPLLEIEAPRLHTLTLKKGGAKEQMSRSLIGMHSVPEVLNFEEISLNESFKPIIEALMPYRMEINFVRPGVSPFSLTLSDLIAQLQQGGSTIRLNGSKINTSTPLWYLA
jgi:hypothetical protein